MKKKQKSSKGRGRRATEFTKPSATELKKFALRKKIAMFVDLRPLADGLALQAEHAHAHRLAHPDVYKVELQAAREVEWYIYEQIDFYTGVLQEIAEEERQRRPDRKRGAA